MSLELFHRLPNEKQEQILNACIEEFAAAGYDLAKTDRMIEKAGISKGVLFKYFSSKEGLFLHLTRHIGEIVNEQTEARLSQVEGDFFETIKRMILENIDLYQTHPHYVLFMYQIQLAPHHPICAKALMQQAEKSAPLQTAIFGRLADSNLRPDVPIEQALHLVNWVLDGFNKKWIPRLPQLSGTDELLALHEEIVADLDAYLTWLRYGICSPPPPTA